MVGIRRRQLKKYVYISKNLYNSGWCSFFFLYGHVRPRASAHIVSQISALITLEFTALVAQRISCQFWDISSKLDNLAFDLSSNMYEQFLPRLLFLWSFLYYKRSYMPWDLVKVIARHGYTAVSNIVLKLSNPMMTLCCRTTSPVAGRCHRLLLL